MIGSYLKKPICVITGALLTALFIITLFFAAPKLRAVPEATGRQITDHEQVTYYEGEDFTAVNIFDLTDLGRLTKVNYVADEFVPIGRVVPNMRIVDLTKPFEFAERGSLIFVILNLDPWDIDNFFAYSQKLAPYKISEYWEFTLSLPAVFCASNIYRNGELVERNGDIAGYDFIDHCNFAHKTEKFVSQIEPTDIVLRFSANQRALNNMIVTVHYQSKGGAYSAVTDCPLIGTAEAVTGVNRTSQGLLLSFAVLAAVVLAVLVVLSVVERSKKFTSAIVWVFGITALLLCRYYLRGVSGAPLFWTALSLAMPFIILGGAQLAICKNIGTARTKFFFPAVSAIGALLALLCPFIPFGAASAMRTSCIVLKAIGAAALIAFTGMAIFDRRDGHGIMQTACASVIAVGITASLFLPQIFPTQINPLFWVCAAATALTFFGVVISVMDIKKSNDYLTENLHKEVERQVKDIKAVIAERDNLLQFVSHDLKKPLSSAVTLCDTAIEREKDAEQVKTIGIIKRDAERVINNLSEIAAYAKLNYLAEPSRVVDIFELCALMYKYHRFDCDANGIILKNTVDCSVKAFVKPKGIENVLSNIIINAIEHASCSEITLSVATDKNRVVLAVADDGKGIDGSLDVFKPYVSENDSATGGVGLYICKRMIDSMNGELTYESSRNGTTFYISLLKA